LSISLFVLKVGVCLKLTKLMLNLQSLKDFASFKKNLTLWTHANYTKKDTMRITIIASILLTFYYVNIYAQKDTSRLINKQVFLQEAKKFNTDSTKIAELFNNTSKHIFFYKMLDKIYDDNSLSNKQSFYALIFTFPEFSNLIPKYNKLKKEVYDISTEHFHKKINLWVLEREMLDNELIMIEEKERQKRIQELEAKHKVDEIKEDTLTLKTDSTLIAPSDKVNIEKNDVNKLEKKLDVEEHRLKEEEKKMLIEKRRLEEERIKMKLEEKKEKDD